MGVVYKAEDTKLNRILALKFLPQHITTNETDKARFLQEAKAASAINHPNVCVIHDIQEYDGQQFIVMEFVAGKTLKEEIQKDNLKVENILNYASQIAEALKAAHDKDIIHRDIKSENIMITGTGQTKVMDFGLARFRGSEHLTKTTSTVGTIAYMSPEHLQGHEVDVRSDIFSYGVVLYEMLTSQLPFKGEYESALIYSILNEEPEPVQKFVPNISSELLHVLNRALEKDPDNRYQNMKEVLIDVTRVQRDSDKIGTKPQSQNRAETRYKKKTFTIFSLALICLFFLMAIMFIFKPFRQRQKEPMFTTSFTTLPGSEIQPAFSPDCNQIAFVWGESQQDANWDLNIYTQIIGTSDYRQLTSHPGHEYSPTWSPDGRHIAFIRFITDTTCGIYRIPAIGGVEEKLLTFKRFILWTHFHQLSWSADNMLAFIYHGGIGLLNMNTLQMDSLSLPPAEPGFYGNPSLSPDGSQIAIIKWNSYNTQEIFIVSVSNGECKQITNDNKAIHGLFWQPHTNKIVFSSNRSGKQNLWRISSKGGIPQPITVGGTNIGHPIISNDNRYLAFVEDEEEKLTIYRTSIEDTEKNRKDFQPLFVTTSGQLQPDWSYDGQNIAFIMKNSGFQEVWTCDLNGRNLRQITRQKLSDTSLPTWSPDGQEIAYSAFKDGSQQLFTIPYQGGVPKQITSSINGYNWHSCYTPDGRYIIFDGNGQIWKIPSNGGEAAQITHNGGSAPNVSRDGKWLFFYKDEEIWKMPVEGGAETFVTEIGYSKWPKCYDVSGDKLIYLKVTEDKYIIEQTDFVTNKKNIIAEIEGYSISWPSVSPNGNDILFCDIKPQESNILLVENSN